MAMNAYNILPPKNSLNVFAALGCYNENELSSRGNFLLHDNICISVLRSQKLFLKKAKKNSRNNFFITLMDQDLFKLDCLECYLS